MARYRNFVTAACLTLTLAACAGATPPLPPTPTAPPTATLAPTRTPLPAAGSTAPAGSTTCPPGYPVKVINGTYVVPGSASYESTNPVSLCFDTAEHAQAAGLSRRVP